MPIPWFKCVYDYTLALVRRPSLTDSADESSFAPYLRDQLAQQPYFQAHPNDLRLERTTDDLHERYNLYALVRGTGPRTVLLTGHYDVVSVENYGELAPYALEPVELLPRLIAHLRQQGDATSQRALRELESGDALPGRGTLDMKSGLAIGMAVLAAFAELPNAERVGNLLFIATPDEEGGSHGMRAAASRLPSLAAEWGLTPVAAINLDSSVNDETGDGRAIFLGSVGKLLPAVYFVGRPTHAGDPFNGVNANLLAAELTRLVECNPAWGDAGIAGFVGEPPPPPISLYQSDRRTHYNVTTPATAWCAFNVLTHTRSPQAVLASMIHITQTAMQNALELLRGRAAQHAAAIGAESVPPPLNWPLRVLTYAQLQAAALARGGATFASEFAQLTHTLASEPQLDQIGLSQRLIDTLVPAAALEGPAAVICFASTYYPKVAVDPSAGENHRRLLAAVEAVTAIYAQESGVTVRLRPFFPGISDMSFLAGRDEPTAIAALTANTPGWGIRLNFDYSIPARLNLPVINLGPWGADYHQASERVYMPYSFGVVPELIWRILHSGLLPEIPKPAAIDC